MKDHQSRTTIYICNVCGKEHDSKNDAVYCHPDIIEEKYKVKTFKNRKGETVEILAEKVTD